MIRWLAEHETAIGALIGASATATLGYLGKRLVDYAFPRGRHFRIVERYSSPNDDPQQEEETS